MKKFWHLYFCNKLHFLCTALLNFKELAHLQGEHTPCSLSPEDFAFGLSCCCFPYKSPSTDNTGCSRGMGSRGRLKPTPL